MSGCTRQVLLATNRPADMLVSVVQDERQQQTVEKLQQLYDELVLYYRNRRRPSGLTMVDNVHAKQSRATWCE